MKHLLAVCGFLLLTCLLGSCDSDLLEVDRKFESTTIAVQLPDGPAGDVSASAEGVAVDLRARIDDYGITTDNLREVVVTRVVATLIDPMETLTFADFEGGSMWFDSAASDAVLIAVWPDAAIGTEVELAMRDADVKAYLLEEEFDVSLKGTTTRDIGKGVSLELAVTYEVIGGL